MNFNERIKALIEEACQKYDIKKSRVLLDGGADPAQFRKYDKEGRLYSDGMLENLANSRYISASLEDMLAWRLLDEYGAQVACRAAEIVQTQDQGDEQ